MKHLLFLLCSILAVACNENVLDLPDPPPARLRIVNVTEDVETLSVMVDSSARLTISRGKASGFEQAAAGRAISFDLSDGNGQPLRRESLYYTLGGGARVLLFVKGSRTGLIEFRRAIQDTVIDPASTSAFVRFTHMAELTDRGQLVELWVKGGKRVFPEDYLPGITSPKAEPIVPGTYTFELRESGTTSVLAEWPAMDVKAGTSVMLYTYDLAPPELDRIGTGAF